MATKPQMKRLVPKSGRAPDPKKKKGLPRVSKGSYHQKAQKFIKSAKSKGMSVKAEGSEIIAYPRSSKSSYKIPKTPSNGIGVGGN